MAKSAALGLTLAGVGTVAIISGIQGKSIGQVLKGELGPPPDPGFSPKVGSKDISEVQGEANAEGEGAIPGEESAGTFGKNPQQGPPPSPGTAAAPIEKIHHAEDLSNKITKALEYKEQLGLEIQNKRITKSHAESLFNSRYPNYGKWTHEFVGK